MQRVVGWDAGGNELDGGSATGGVGVHLIMPILTGDEEPQLGDVKLVVTHEGQLDENDDQGDSESFVKDLLVDHQKLDCQDLLHL